MCKILSRPNKQSITLRLKQTITYMNKKGVK